jgi:hypothetical protein
MDEKDDEKAANVVPLRLLLGGSAPSDSAIAVNMMAAQRNAQMMNALRVFWDLAAAGKLDAICIIAREKKPPVGSGGVMTLVAPADHNSFEIQGMINAALHFEIQKLRVERPDPPTEPSKPGA